MLKVVIISTDTLNAELIGVLLPPFCSAEIYSPDDDIPENRLCGFGDVVILDLEVPNWTELLATLCASPTGAPVLGMAEPESVNTIVQAIRSGAINWLPKPVKREYLDRLLAETSQLSVVPVTPEKEPAMKAFLGEGQLMLKAKNLIRRFAPADQPILLTGESGSGKGVAAKAIHDLSQRRNRPFCFRNCAALPAPLLESELFGTRSGSYTGAIDRAGIFEISDQGTLFLDEIAEIPPENQAKLLRVIEEGVFFRIGSTQAATTDTRVIAATNRNLEEMVKEKTFREDLFYRLNILPIHIPPLREHKEDIPLLSAHFLEGSEKYLTHRAMDRLIDYDWPGNIRQLNACLARARLLTDDERISHEHLEFH